jgi:hypothetical protein
VTVAAVDNSAILESATDGESLSLLNEPETNTMVLWVNDDDAGGSIVSADLAQDTE